MGDVFDINSDHPLFDKVPFVQVFDDAKNGNWKAAKYNQHWCKANFESQCSIQQGLTYFLTSLEVIALQKNDKYMLKTLLPEYREQLVFDKVELFFEVKETILSEAQSYIISSKDNCIQMNVGMHLRRGDFKYFNCDQRALKLEGQRGEEVLEEWLEADNKFQDRNYKTRLELRVVCHRFHVPDWLSRWGLFRKVVE